MDWSAMKAEYIAGTATYRELAKKYGVALSTLQTHAKEGEWREGRRKYRDKVVTKALARTGARDAARLAKLQKSVMRLADDMERAISDPEMPYKHVGSDEGTPTEARLSVPNGKNLLALARALRETTAAMRDLYGISTRAEQLAQEQAAQRLQMERERLEMDKRRAEAEQTDSTVEIILPPELERYAK